MLFPHAAVARESAAVVGTETLRYAGCIVDQLFDSWAKDTRDRIIGLGGTGRGCIWIVNSCRPVPGPLPAVHPMLASIILAAFVVAALIQLSYWMLIRTGLRRVSRLHTRQAPSSRDSPAPGREPLSGRTEPEDGLPPVSVIVAARNEESRLPTLLHALSRQSHPRIEVIVVDDGSSDRTPDVLGGWTASLPPRVIRTDGIGKKRALARGIRAATHETLAFTDADCAPPVHWLAHLASVHAEAESPTVLIGYSPFRPAGSMRVRPGGTDPPTRPDPGVERLARYETFITGVFTAAAAAVGHPYMAVGRNISYPRSVFDRVGGFASIMHSLSGDDDLFVQEVRRAGAAKVRALVDPATFVPTASPARWREWLRQKRRHTSAGRFYRWDTKAHLALFHATNLLVWTAPLFLGWMGLALLVAKAGVQYAVVRRAALRFHETDLLTGQPILEALYLGYNVLVAPIGLMRIPGRW